MANLNKVMIMGNLTRDPELRYTPKGSAVADISIAINERQKVGETWEDKTLYVDVTLWGKTAELAQQYLSKGRGCFIEGRLQMDTWEDKKTGQKRSKIKVVADSIQFLPDGKVHQRDDQSRSQGQGHLPARTNQPNHPTYADLDDLPF